MKERLLEWLACPECGGKLSIFTISTIGESDPDGKPVLDVEEGLLHCACTRAYPVFEGVPRLIPGCLAANEAFLGRHRAALHGAGLLGGKALAPPDDEFKSLIQPTLERFRLEWENHPLDQHTWGWTQETRLNQALGYLGWTAEQARDRVLLDAGCGTAKLTCGMATWGGEVVGLDLAPTAVRGWKARKQLAGKYSSRVHIVQGNLMAPPFRPGVFDGVHSLGVLHHTPDTHRAFRAVTPLVKPGGTLSVWLYIRGTEEGGLPWFPFVRSRWALVSHRKLRRFTPRLPPRLLYALLWLYSAIFHVFYTVGAALHGKRHGQTIRERTTSIFDALAPPFDWRHDYAEVSGWYESAGFVSVRNTTIAGDIHGFNVTGVRTAS